MTTRPPGVDICPGCGHHVLFAVSPGGSVIALDPDERGGVVGWEDDTRTARCRPDNRGQLALGEYLFRPHGPCPAVAPVIPLRPRAGVTAGRKHPRRVPARSLA